MTDRGKRADMIVHEVQPYNAEPPAAALAGQPRTAADTFYSRNHGSVPELDPGRWRLTVDGVPRPLDVDLAALQRDFPEVTVVATLQCAGNRRAGFLAVRDIPGEAPWGPGATSTAAWTGVRLADVLAAAGLAPDGSTDGDRHVVFRAPDVSTIPDRPQPYEASIPLAKARGGEVLLAWAMDGAPLTALHGAPVRVVVPGWIGARSVKWVRAIGVQAEPAAGYFQSTAYRLLAPEADPSSAGPGDGLSLGPAALDAAVLSPADGAQVPAGPTLVQGYAFAGEGHQVFRVDVSGDGGASWQQAELAGAESDWAWQLWRTELDLAVGEHEVVVRAWDTTGAQQPESAASLWNPKGYVNHSWHRVAVLAS